MKKCICAVLTACFLLGCMPVWAAGAEITPVFRFDYENGSVGADIPYRKDANAVTVIRGEDGGRYLSIRMDDIIPDPAAGDMYYQLQADRLTDDYLTDPDAATQPHYYNADRFIFSCSLSTEGTPCETNIHAVTTGKTARPTLFNAASGGQVRTGGGTALGTVSPGSWLHLTAVMDLSAQTVTYFADGVMLVADEAMKTGAETVSYFNFGIHGKESNQGTSLLVDNLTPLLRVGGPVDRRVFYTDIPARRIGRSAALGRRSAHSADARI